MGKSNSCFKLITCGGDAGDKNDLDVSEVKDSNVKHGWSFGKRSARHRVLSNTIISEAASGNKETSECIATNFPHPANSTVVEKISSTDCSDKSPQLSTLENPKTIEAANLKTEETAVVTEIENEVEIQPEDSVVIIIQTSIRGFLARRELLKLKNVVQLQAAVRGQLARRHAVGTLRCVQAIVKMQALVRARHARSLEGPHAETKSNQRHGRKNGGSKTSGKEKNNLEANVTYVSIQKLLSNSYARQLLESSPKTKSIHIKCDPSKGDSAWRWLERWTSLSSIEMESKEVEAEVEQLVGKKDEVSGCQLESEIQSEVNCQPPKSVFTSSEGGGHLIHDANSSDMQAHPFASYVVKDNLKVSLPENDTLNETETSLEINSCRNQRMQSEESVLKEIDPSAGKSHAENEQPKRAMKRVASDQLETEVKKSVFGSRKAGNPAFIAAQTKFEELSATADAVRSSAPSSQDTQAESQAEMHSSCADTTIQSKKLSSAEHSAIRTSNIHVAGSECGTELSITSTLDSPDRSEFGAVENEHDSNVLVEETCNHDITENLDDKKCMYTILMSKSDNPVSDKPETLDAINTEVVSDSKETEPNKEGSAFDLQKERESETVHQDYRSSPEASPRSHITIPESQGTPSSQVSVKPKVKKTDKISSNNKRKSLSAGKNSPSKANHGSVSRGNIEHISKDQKSGKTYNIFGTARPDHIDQEPRDSSSSSNSLPHFMQATESARAKINANNSPRSSPDVLDREINVKKRHSLPSVTGRQGSPRIQRSMSQVQQGAKGNGLHPPQERKWQR